MRSRHQFRVDLAFELCRTQCALVIACSCLVVGTLRAADVSRYIPDGEPEDPVMASRQEIAEMADWVSAGFLARSNAATEPAIRVQLRHQDHNTLHFGESVLNTPLTIGKRRFQRGLGTHANSEIVVSIPAGATAFKAFAGVDDNYDTAGQHGTVQFIVVIGGREVLRTGTLKGGGAPAEIRVPIPKGATELVLKTDATADGTAFDQADWADPCFIDADGKPLWLDENPPTTEFLDSSGPPFSFVYDGHPSGGMLRQWARTAETRDQGDRILSTVRWTDSKTKLSVSASVTCIKKYPAAEWVLQFENRGETDSPLLENIQALDALVQSSQETPARLHSIAGDSAGERSFVPLETPLGPGQSIRLAPQGGRSSNGTFPFYNLECGNRGLFVGVGWSGQWAASLERNASGSIRLQAGLEKTRLRLHPGEKIRSPRILLMGWKQDRTTAHNRFRRLMLFHYTPKENGRPVAVPAFFQNYDRYNMRPDWASETGQIQAAGVAAQAGAEALWLDAAWFVGHFPNGVGNWTPKPDAFPRGLKPISEECHRRGLKFMAWFEPERVAPGSLIAREHPEFVFGGEQGGLFRLNDPVARRWLTELLNQRINEFGLDWYRNDFNIDPLPFWRATDAEDRQGMTEIRYIEGLYEMWDALRAAHPGLQIDNCASGGRRLDLETCMRSLPLWQSDTACSPGHPEWNQAQAYGLSLYLPFHQSCAWTPAANEMRATAAAGVTVQFDYLAPGFPLDEAKAALEEAKACRKYWYGDFYPLTPCTVDPGQFHVVQFHRPDLGEGVVLAMRRRDCELVGLITELRAINPAALYQVELSDETRQKTIRTMTGEELRTNLPLRILARPGSLLVRYKLLPP